MFGRIRELIKQNPRVAIFLVVIVGFIIFGVSGEDPIISLPGTTPQFEVRSPEEAPQPGGVEEDESLLFHSPISVLDEGIYYQDPAPTVEESATEVAKISGDFPIFIDNVQTSSDIATSISMYVRSGGRQDVLTISVNGINFNENEASGSNPQYTAFVESLRRSRDELVRRGVDPDRLLISFGTRQYIIETAGNWARISNAF